MIKAQRFEDTVRVGHTRLILRVEVENFRRLPPEVKKKRTSLEVILATLEELEVSTGDEKPNSPTVET